MGHTFQLGQTMTEQLPSAIEFEKYALAECLHGDSFRKIAETLNTEDLFLESHRRIFTAMKDLDSTGCPVEIRSVSYHLRDSGKLESVGGISYLSDLVSLPRIVNIEYYCSVVRDKAILRSAIAGWTKLIEQAMLGSGPTNEILAQAEKMAKGLVDGRSTGEFHSFKDILDSLGGINAIGSKPRSGISTPFPQLNHFLGSMTAGQLIMIGARPGTGKTALGGQMARHCAMQGRGAAWFSLEMSKEELFERTASGAAQVDSVKVRTGRLSDVERYALLKSIGEMVDLPIWICDRPSGTVSAMRAMVRRLMSTRDVGMVIVDYLQIAEAVGKSENRNQEVSKISRGLKLMAKELGVPVVAMCQLSRDNEKLKRPPELTDLRESGSLEQDADVVLFLHSDAKNNTGDLIPTRLIIAKQRAGKAKRQIQLLFDERSCLFYEATKENENG